MSFGDEGQIMDIRSYSAYAPSAGTACQGEGHVILPRSHPSLQGRDSAAKMANVTDLK